MKANEIITAYIKAAMARGMDIEAAWDSIYGEGAYKALAADVYRTLRGE